ncbi:50S ribosomal protein L6 [Candidatus Peregrinibacteria bacterium CG_4_10_14_0_2_um_filter_43_11]|nr:MAG: 50S ribosomal protein L6 [Candidatus Peregrinibacteria bacterium CG_4_10_14_0_2_um_filter_43_11]
MSKIGKMPIIVPTGVEVSVADSMIHVKGPKGQLQASLPLSIQIIHEDNLVLIKRKGDGAQERSYHGLIRSLVNNMIIGVFNGFEKRLEIIGVGYRAQISGKKITLSLGFSHPIDYVVPEGITIEMDKEQKNTVVICGIDKQVVGQVASDIRSFRPPEPYKGKGIRYVGEHVVRKSGKTAGAKE